MNMAAPRPAIRTTCAYCGVGCGVLATPDGLGGLGIAGDPEHPANFGRLCVKGAALGETLALDGRLLAPRIHGREAGWDAALDLVARRFSETIAAHGPDSVAMYVSGQLLTEDYYVANKLMKGFIGSANIDTNSRLCMASSVAGHRRAFGSDTVPGLYEDLEQADTVVLVGSNLAWCHPVLFQRLAAARAARGTRVVVIDPRRTATCDIADLHLAIAPGADAALFNLLLADIDRRGLVAADPAGLAEALAAARATTPAATGLPHSALQRFLDLWCGSARVVTVYSQGINQSDSGTDKVNAILNCHLATGRIGRPGMGPFSVTGQPNAMGGREVGGLANMLACHLALENPAHRAAVQGFWVAPRMAEKPGLKAVDLFRAVEAGRIKALWIICTNPAVTMPEADRVARAIAGCAFTVVSDLFATTDTARLAHVLLPATGWGEKDGTVTNSERRISRQRRALPAPDPGHPFRLNTGRVRDHWHTMTRSGRAPRLSRHLAEPFLELHPQDAARLGLEPATLAEIANPLGRAILRVLVTDRVAPGHPFAPMHWTGETAPSGRIDALVPGLADPVSGQPALKSAAVAIRPFPAAWYGFAVSIRAMAPDWDYWASATLPGGFQAELAGTAPPEDWAQAAQRLFGLDDPPQILRDDRRGILRLAFARRGRVQAALFVAPGPVALSRSHLAAALGNPCEPGLLAGRPGGDRPDGGAVVCACLGVGVNTILEGIRDGLASVEAIGEALGAGTSCGSCRPELRALLARQPA